MMIFFIVRHITSVTDKSIENDNRIIDKAKSYNKYWTHPPTKSSFFVN